MEPKISEYVALEKHTFLIWNPLDLIGFTTVILFDNIYIYTLNQVAFCTVNNYSVDEVITHARRCDPCKNDDKELGPHLTQQSAQVDHWALYRKTKLMKEHIALKLFPLK